MSIAENEKQTVSIIMPIYNGETTIKKTLESLLAQSERFDELVIIDDASSDGSVQEIKKYLNGKRDYTLIINEKQTGLAAAYNKGIKVSKGNIIISLHQDIILEKDAIKKLAKPFFDKQIVASTHTVTHPMEIWNRYNFWQKCFFARLAGKNFQGIDGKFDAFRKSALEKVGLFDEKNFHTAGEDGDMVFKLKKVGRVADTDARIIHLHKIDPHFNWKDIIRKQAQYSEAQGALLARARIRGVKKIIKVFFREIMLMSLFIPYLNVIALALIFAYSFVYTGAVYLQEYKNTRIALLPFFNIYLLFVSFAYSLKGFIFKRQTT